ncbi:OsmC family protein [Parasediminibacterium sp. JCM 36343]|uniref:OsmC family protein n=1 Tax=Parasediminibacterium sp. JCM 36343 TaxID=3374279 RepID=UPI00397DF0BF
MTTAHITTAHYQVTLTSNSHQFIADEPLTVGGKDTGPAPDNILEAALASCTAITLRMYADRKQWPVESIDVAVQVQRIDNKTVFTRNITLHGQIDEEQKERLLQIAKACPVSKSLMGEIEINSLIV